MRGRWRPPFHAVPVRTVHSAARALLLPDPTAALLKSLPSTGPPLRLAPWPFHFIQRSLLRPDVDGTPQRVMPERRCPASFAFLSVPLQRWEPGFAFRWMDPTTSVICFTYVCVCVCENAVVGPRGFARGWGFEFSAVYRDRSRIVVVIWAFSLFLSLYTHPIKFISYFRRSKCVPASMHLSHPSRFLFLVLVLVLCSASSLAAAPAQSEHDLHDRSATPDHHDHTSSPRTSLHERAAVAGFCVDNSNSRYNCQVGEPAVGHTIPLGTCWDWRCAIPRQNGCSCPSTERRLSFGGRPDAPAGLRSKSLTSSSPSSSSPQRLPPPARPRPPPPPRPQQQRPPFTAPQSAARLRLVGRTPRPEPGIGPSRAVSPDHISAVRLPGKCGRQYQHDHNCVLGGNGWTAGASCHDWRCAVPGRRTCVCPIRAAHATPRSTGPPPMLR